MRLNVCVIIQFKALQYRQKILNVGAKLEDVEVGDANVDINFGALVIHTLEN